MASREEIEKAVNSFNVSQFRKKVKATYPHVKVSIRTVSFSDLARASATFATIKGAKYDEWRQIETWAREAGVIPQ